MSTTQIKRVILVTGRSLSQAMSMEAEGKFSKKYFDAAALVEINPNDADELGLTDRCKVTGRQGSLILKVKRSGDVPPGTIFIPLGPWASILVDHETESTGMPNLKGISVDISPTDGNITSLEDVLRMYGFKHFDYKPEDRPIKTGERKIIKDVVCTFCGELCDYIEVELDGEKIVRAKGACAISSSKFLNYHRHRILKPMIRNENGILKEVSFDEAINKAAEILANSKYPLLFGWSNTSNQAMEIGMYMAEVLGGVVDNTTVICHGPTALGVQEVGAARCTLGVVRHLADLIIIWGSNAVHAHPNHLVRFIFSEGRHRKGKKDRKLVVVDVRKTDTAKRADLFIQVEPGRDFELVTALRMALKDYEIEVPNVAGVPKERIIELVEMMRTAKYGVIFIGMGVTMTGAKLRTIQEVIKLVHDLNDWTRFALIPMRGHWNVTGTNQVMLYNTGYPYSIQYSDGFPRMIVGVTTATDVLIHGEADAALIIASDPVAHLPRKAIEHLARIPKIVIDPKWSLTASVADIIIPSTITGIENDGVAYRMDEVPINTRKIVDPPEKSRTDVEILRILLDKILELKVSG